MWLSLSGQTSNWRSSWHPSLPASSSLQLCWRTPICGLGFMGQHIHVCAANWSMFSIALHSWSIPSVLYSMGQPLLGLATTAAAAFSGPSVTAAALVSMLIFPCSSAPPLVLLASVSAFSTWLPLLRGLGPGGGSFHVLRAPGSSGCCCGGPSAYRFQHLIGLPDLY